MFAFFRAFDELARSLLCYRQSQGRRVISQYTGTSATDKAAGNRVNRTAAAAASLLAAGCGDGTAPPAAEMPVAADFQNAPVRSATAWLAEPAYATADTALGERLLSQCQACHTFGAGEEHRLGPNLHGIFGRTAGTIEGFSYTRAFEDAGFTWTPGAMDAWLAQPWRFLPGNAMAYGGIPGAEARAAVIAAMLRRQAATESNAAAGDAAATIE